jgi:hypothetical protein
MNEPTEAEREDLFLLVLENTYQAAEGECRRAADAIFAAGFRRVIPVTDAHAAR